MNLESDILYSVGRLLSLLDTNEISPTYGCFDRPYWHYRIAADFPSAIYQRGVLALAGLYSINFSGNRYYKDAGLKKLCIAGMEFWAGIQNRDGSFSEWFPGERSLVATAFTSYAISEAIILMNGEIEGAKKEIILNSLRRAAGWMCRWKERFVANHTAGQVAALYNIFLVTGEERFKIAAGRKIEELARFQDDEGWFYEYGGCDIGYLSVSVDYLAKYYKASRDEKALDMAVKALEFMRYFVHPDGSAGGRYSSRNTAYIMRHGLHILKEKTGYASEILAGLKEDMIPDAGSVDDRYFAFFFLPDLIQSQGEVSRPSLPSRPQGNFTRLFKGAGLLSIKNDAWHLIVGGSKGGVVKLFRRGATAGLIFSDCGYCYKDSRLVIYTTQWQNSRAEIAFEESGESMKIVIKTRFARSGINSRASTLKLMLLRLYMALFGWNSHMACFMEYCLKKVLIAGKRTINLNLERIIGIEGNAINITDRIYGRDARMVHVLFRGSSFTESSSPTSRYFYSGEHIRKDENLSEEAKGLAHTCEVLIKRRVDVGSN